jgi:hypothetical protein
VETPAGAPAGWKRLLPYATGRDDVDLVPGHRRARGSACPTPDRQEETADALASVREIPGKAWINLESWRDGS